jgi:hypothetical protein
MTDHADQPSEPRTHVRKGGRAARIERARPVRTPMVERETVNTWSLEPGDTKDRTLVIACGAIIAELRQVIEMNRWAQFELTGVPADYHVTPDKITTAVEAKIRWAKERYARILVGYGDCGTRGSLDQMLAREGVERIEGAHCYAFFAGIDAFNAMHEAEAGTFYLTDFLARHFEAFSVRGLGIDKHPELKELYFGNYKRVIYLAQLPTPDRIKRAEDIAAWFGVPLEVRETGLSGLEEWLEPREG